jgi:hypothetical protein
LSFHSFQDAKLQNNYELQKKMSIILIIPEMPIMPEMPIINFGKGASRTGKNFGKVYTAK